ncbi:hypothetical protein NC652_022325 [Populus alba x Populus x berolinensis]|nr:hypothetical protein NC652_022325 [Populus alba x Populus x berolinensis]
MKMTMTKMKWITLSLEEVPSFFLPCAFFYRQHPRYFSKL